MSYLKIAKAARYCEDHFTAVIYCEIYARNRLDDDLLSFETSLRDKNLCDIMNDAYLSIGLRDGQDVFVKLLKSRNSLETTSNRSLVELDVAYHSNKDCSAMYQAALMKNGMYALAKSIPSEDPQYECLWRLGDWSALIEADSETVDHSKALDLQVDYEKYHYTALKCLSNLDELGTTTAINRGRKIIVQVVK